MTRHLWIDASAGVAGDMLLGALADAGARVSTMQAAVDAVLPGGVTLTAETTGRAGLRAVRVSVAPLVESPPHRRWGDIGVMLRGAALEPPVRDRAVAVFSLLAGVEGWVHGIPAAEVHFHEVGSVDSIADVVGVCAALHELGVGSVSAGAVALGSGRIRTAHGELPVPAPAVLELSRGWRVSGAPGDPSPGAGSSSGAGSGSGSEFGAGSGSGFGFGELATPTGMAVIRALATVCEELPPMEVEAIGVGAGGRDTPGRPNVVRVVIGTPSPASHASSVAPGTPSAASDSPSAAPDGLLAAASFGAGEPAILLEANVDDLDPRLWPGILQGLMEAGAADAWLTPILMKKGRPAHTLAVLCAPARAETLRTLIFRDTSTLGVRESPRTKTPLPRTFRTVDIPGGTVTIKLGHRDGLITHAMPEFEDVATLARATGQPERLILHQALTAAAEAGLTPGAPLPT